jgi:DNA-binding GntR family transcriptional regulator
VDNSPRLGEPLVIEQLPPRQALADDVYEAVKALIMDAKVQPGGQLTIDTLARELGVSQTPVREALARLESDGLVVKQGKRGYFATHELNAQEIEEMYALRLLLEPWAAARAADLASKDDARALTGLIESVPAMPKALGYRHLRVLANHDAAFHGHIFDLAQNTFVQHAFERSHCFLHLFRVQYNQPETLRSTGATLDEHRAIAKAVTSGDGDRAAAAMRAHLEGALGRLRALSR